MKTESERRLPAEWEPQSAVMLTWPHAASDWQPWLPEVEPVFVAIAGAVCRHEHLLVSCHDESHRAHVEGLLRTARISPSAFHLHVQPSNDTWVRDHGPITVLAQGRPLLLDFIFNGWGDKFEAGLDNRLTAGLHAQGAFGATPLEPVDLVMEGGSLETDGAGTLLTTTRCLLAPTRNPALSRADIEERLRHCLGVRHFLWLEHGYLAGDDTDSHIDTLARLCPDDTIAYVRCDDHADEHYPELQAMEQELMALRTPGGRPYRLIPLPWPGARHADDGRRLPATYANFLIINGAVLAPTYEDVHDDAALAALQTCFPDRDIIAIDCLPLIQQYGSLHCVTMQLPAGVLDRQPVMRGASHAE